MKHSHFWIAIGAIVGFSGVYAADVNGDAQWIKWAGLAGLAICTGIGLLHGVMLRRAIKTVATVSLVILNGCGDPDPNAWRTQDNSEYAFVLSQGVAKDHLKAPSTAEFPSMTDKNTLVAKSGHEYTIYSWVDAQNSFGAMIRTEYTCKVVQVGEYDWRFVDFQFAK
ncbi:MAG: hypothetical protein HGB02_08515 [Chlorobiaceae bacterium]|nr:hypothetical protein [Chlorobiaceae bacterium]